MEFEPEGLRCTMRRSARCGYDERRRPEHRSPFNASGSDSTPRRRGSRPSTTCSASAKNSQRSVRTPAAALQHRKRRDRDRDGAAAWSDSSSATAAASGTTNSSSIVRQPQPARVTPRHLIAHLAHHEVGLGVRRIERPHRAEMAEAGGGFGGAGLRRRGRSPTSSASSSSQPSDQQHARLPRPPSAVRSRRRRAEASAARRRWPAPAPRRSARPAAGARRGWSAAMRRSFRCTTRVTSAHGTDEQRARRRSVPARTSPNTQPSPSAACREIGDDGGDALARQPGERHCDSARQARSGRPRWNVEVSKPDGDQRERQRRAPKNPSIGSRGTRPSTTATASPISRP